MKISYWGWIQNKNEIRLSKQIFNVRNFSSYIQIIQNIEPQAQKKDNSIKASKSTIIFIKNFLINSLLRIIKFIEVPETVKSEYEIANYETINHEIINCEIIKSESLK